MERTPPYWHELSEQDRVSALGWCRDREMFNAHFRQPSWCGYHDKVGCKWGCYSLMMGRVSGPEFCAGCDFMAVNWAKVVAASSG